MAKKNTTKKTAKKGKMSSEQTANGSATETVKATEKTSAPESVKGEALKGRYLATLHFKQIGNRLDWNVRGKAALLANDGPREGQTGLGTFAAEDDEKEGLKKGEPRDGMVRMLADDGQKTPIDVYPHPTKPDHFLLADGATRYEAAKLLHEHKHSIPGLEPGTIEAYVYPNMTESDAEDWNLARATDHRDLKTADLAFGIARSGKRLSDTEIARRLGTEQSYVSKLHRIVKNAPAIAKLWRETHLEIGHIEVGKIVALPVDQREEAWAALMKKKMGGGEGEGAEGTGVEWLTKAEEGAAKAGKILGVLDARGLVDVSAVNFDASLTEIAEAFGFKLKAPGKDGKEATRRQKAKIAKAAEEAFAIARTKIVKESEAALADEKAAQAGTAPDVEHAPAN